MQNCSAIRQAIKHINTYVTGFPITHRSAAIEQLFSEAMGYMFHLKLFTILTDNSNINHKVVWLGQDAPILKNAPAFGPDAVVFARHFDVLVEMTLKTGALQWDGEFSRAVRHIEDYIRETKMERNDVYLILLVSEIYV